VWGLVSNLENSNVDTTSVLNTTSSRDNLVNNLIAAAITYDLDGINVDMEALSIQAKDGYIEFIRELSLKCEKNDIILSIDNYVPTDSTAFYNRSVQADYADYIIIMAYDEHTSTDTEAGSVSSIGFVEKGIKDTLEEVPEKQVIVGLPFYARVWATSGDTLSSSAYGMDSLSDYLDAHGASRTWSETEGQYYAEFTENDTIYQCWIEDTTSLSRKLDLMKEYNLAGAAFWKLGFESKAIWTMIDNYK
jgi:spore germination protein YaaH